MGQYSGRKSKKRTNPTVKTSDVKDFTSEQILEALRAWQSESEAVDAKAILRALRLYRSGNFTVRLPEDKTGIAGEIARAFNESVELNQLLTKEFERIGKAVGKEGNLDQRITIGLAAGSWANQINAFNSTLDYMVEPVREFSRVVTAVSKGDLSEPMPLDIGGRAVKGEFLRVAKVTNKMIDLLNNFSSEVTRVAQEVGTDGKLGGQAKVKGVTGVWRDLTDNVNAIADNLTSQVRNISDVATAVAKGDLDQKITVEVKGEFLQLKNTINSMVDQLAQFSSEVTRVAQEVGTYGKLGGQANVRGVSGVWNDLTNNVNAMAENLTYQVCDIAKVATAVAEGDLDKKITVEAKGEIADLKNTINSMVEQLSQFSSEVTRVAQEVGTDGKLGGQAEVKGVGGVWKDLTNNVNAMADNLTSQVRDIATVATAVAEGDLEQKITVEAKGEIADLKTTINSMVDQLSQFSSEVTRVAQEVGTDGKLGGQAEVKGVSGVWKDLTSNVNAMADNLTNQVRDIAKVTTAIADGNLNQRITVEVKGEILQLKNTINSMVDQLAQFSSEVTRVAQEVGTDGELGGQADVPDASGTWRSLTDNVNELADNLTRQVRAIFEVVTTITRGDLSAVIEVDAKGEVEDLKNGLNTMIKTLKSTSELNAEQDWLKTNLSKFGDLMQGRKDLQNLTTVLIEELCKSIVAQHGVFYFLDKGTEDSPKEPELQLLSSYAYKERKNISNVFPLGKGLVGQCGLEQKTIFIKDVPSDYIKINSGLGETTPLNLVLLPVLFEDELVGVIELASFEAFSENTLNFLDQLVRSVGLVTNTVKANMRTENLLKESQALSEELQTQQDELEISNKKLEEQARKLQESEVRLKRQQEELQQTNEELEEKSNVLADQKVEVQQKNQLVTQAKEDLQEKADQLTLTSKYKSEFLANMSHELRTPLNSLLVLSEALSKNADKNLNKKQLKHASTIYDSGVELLDLINEILDMAKIESGTMSIDISDIFFSRLGEWSKRGFQQVAENKKIGFDVALADGLPKSIRTDEKRLQQVLKNLISNAIKFTEQGSVNLNISIETEGWNSDHAILSQAATVIAFSVVDTGIGIAEDKQHIIFEAFQQAVGATNRIYGSTGLGLSISREIAVMLGGEITLTSELGKGSAFTFYVPLHYIKPELKDLTHAQAEQISALKRLPNSTTSTSIEIGHGQELLLPSEVLDDRSEIGENDKVVLIIEDDVKFANILLEMARAQGFKAIVMLTGEAGLACAQEYQPDAIILDIRLPAMSGWTVLDRIKHNSTIRHIPVHIASIDDVRQRSLKSGALSFMQKPADQKKLSEVFGSIKKFGKKKYRKLLLIDDNQTQRENIVELIGNGDVVVTAVASAEEALKQLKTVEFDCMVLDLMLPDMSGFELIEKIKTNKKLINLPIIIYTGKELSKTEENKLKAVAETIIIKDVMSPERLLDETALFLHRVESKLPEPKRKMLQQVNESDPTFIDRKILIVDDDMRNIYALSAIFEGHNANILYAESGVQALDSLKKNTDIELVLMDIMMPEMDGYETMQIIRTMAKFKDLPIIAVTAKAMKEDREKCIAAGASDYIVKPINTEQLLSLARVWLYK
jgi:CheY-like chemotaxis protein/HAMP domain-containing protein/GAF domain-containing protein